MAEWSHGYDVSVGYTFSFFREMAPDWLDFCLRVNGYEPPRPSPQFRYLDLGCGQGFHLCVLAAANPQAEFVGIDFKQEHVAHAQELAAAASLTNVRFVQADFLDLAAEWPKDFGTFDYVVLQGIFSWVSSTIRDAAVQCIAAGSKPGTLTYCGYNAVPGWLGTVPFHHVVNRLGKELEAHAALAKGVSIFEQLRDGGAAIFRMQPLLKARIDAMDRQEPNYLVHEYLTDHWTPLWHSQVARELERAGSAYLAPATLAEALLPSALPPPLLKVVAERSEPALRQDVQDIAINQIFRRDIFCFGPAHERRDGSANIDIPIHLLSTPAEGSSIKFETAFGEVTRGYEAVADIVEALATGPQSFAELLALRNPARPHPRRLLLLLIDVGILGVGTKCPAPVKAVENFNAAVARGAASGREYRHLSGAALGTGVPTRDFDLLFFDAWLESDRRMDARGLATSVLKRMNDPREGSLENGLRGPGGHEFQTQMENLASIFVATTLPRWRSLGVLQ